MLQNTKLDSRKATPTAPPVITFDLADKTIAITSSATRTFSVAHDGRTIASCDRRPIHRVLGTRDITVRKYVYIFGLFFSIIRSLTPPGPKYKLCLYSVCVYGEPATTRICARQRYNLLNDKNSAKQLDVIVTHKRFVLFRFVYGTTFEIKFWILYLRLLIFKNVRRLMITSNNVFGNEHYVIEIRTNVSKNRSAIFN